MLTASGAVKDDFLILREGGKFGPELGKGDGSLQLQAFELLVTVIGTDEQGLPTPHFLKGFMGINAGCCSHTSLLINRKEVLSKNQRENLVRSEEKQ